MIIQHVDGGIQLATLIWRVAICFDTKIPLHLRSYRFNSIVHLIATLNQWKKKLRRMDFKTTTKIAHKENKQTMVRGKWKSSYAHARAHTHTQRTITHNRKRFFFVEAQMISFLPFLHINKPNIDLVCKISFISNIFILALNLPQTLDLQLRPLRTHTHTISNIITGFIWNSIRFSAWQICYAGERARARAQRTTHLLHSLNKVKFHVHKISTEKKKRKQKITDVNVH